MTCKHSNHPKGNTNYIKSMKTLNLWHLPTNGVSKYHQNPLKMSVEKLFKLQKHDRLVTLIKVNFAVSLFHIGFKQDFHVIFLCHSFMK